jgi:hypothetical protein
MQVVELLQQQHFMPGAHHSSCLCKQLPFLPHS